MYPPIQYVNCKAPHKVTNKACPTRAKAHMAGRHQHRKSTKKAKSKKSGIPTEKGKKPDHGGAENSNSDISDKSKNPETTPALAHVSENSQTQNVAAVQEPEGEQPEIIDSHLSVDEEEL